MYSYLFRKRQFSAVGQAIQVYPQIKFTFTFIQVFYFVLNEIAPSQFVSVKPNGEDVATVLNDIWTEESFTFLQTDNGPEFRSSAVQNWCKNHAVTQVFSRPGKPTDNCFIESFNRTFRDECLNENYFTSLSEEKKIIENWRIDYNENRP